LNLDNTAERRQWLFVLAEAGADRMYVRVDQARQYGFPPEIDHARARAAFLENRIIRADGGDSSILDRDRLRNRKLSVGRHNLSVVQNQVGISRQ
jgi:hypothetical protein